MKRKNNIGEDGLSENQRDRLEGEALMRMEGCGIPDTESDNIILVYTKVKRNGKKKKIRNRNNKS